MKIGKRHQTRVSQIDAKKEKQRHCSRKDAKNAKERQEEVGNRQQAIYKTIAKGIRKFNHKKTEKSKRKKINFYHGFPRTKSAEDFSKIITEVKVEKQAARGDPRSSFKVRLSRDSR